MVATPTWTGVALPLVGAACGVFLIVAPSAFGYIGTEAESSQRIVGPCMAVFFIVAAWEVTRNVRWWNAPLALWLLVEPLILEGPASAKAAAVAACIAVMVLIVLTHPGRIAQRYAGGWAALWRRDAYGAGRAADSAASPTRVPKEAAE